jgi:hypothetical protein
MRSANQFLSLLSFCASVAGKLFGQGLRATADSLPGSNQSGQRKIDRFHVPVE